MPSKFVNSSSFPCLQWAVNTAQTFAVSSSCLLRRSIRHSSRLSREHLKSPVPCLFLLVLWFMYAHVNMLSDLCLGEIVSTILD